MISTIKAKTILSTFKMDENNIFGIRYNMNLYRGCQHQCIYCDSRSKCYQIENLADILIKENAIELLEKELRSKRTKGAIGLGSMNDAYMPIEKEKRLTRSALELILKYRFGVHIITKSNLVLRDIDLLKEISKVYTAVSFTITAAEDDLSKKIEPGAPSSSKRFEAIKELSNNGIYTGITMMPILPYITDYEENIEKIVKEAKKAGAKYIIGFMGTSQREGQREYFYNKLDQLFPGTKEKYISRFGNNYSCPSPDSAKLYKLFYDLCSRESIDTKMKFFIEQKPEQSRLF
jgi:DNA repair photolyase